MQAKLVECTNHRAVYGILRVYCKSTKEVQNKIYEIKNDFCEKGIDDWGITDVLKQFPKDWNWNFTYFPKSEDVIEI